MLKMLSKSVLIMFLFDFTVLFVSTIFWYYNFNLDYDYMLLITVLTVLTGCVVLFLKDNYKIREFNITLKNAYLLFEGIVFTMFPATIALLVLDKEVNSAWFILSNLFTIWFVLLIYRFLFHFYLFKIKRVKNVLIIGHGHQTEIISGLIKDKVALKMHVAGYFEYENLENNYEKINKKLDELTTRVKNEDIDILILANDKPFDELFFLSLFSKDVIPDKIKVYRMYDFYEMATGKYYVDDISLQEFIYCFHSKNFKAYNFFKRILDIIAALIILTVTLPITAYIAVRVKLTDGKSPFYTQDRVGKGGKIFKAYKLRTMYDNDFVPKDNKKVGYVENQDEDDRVIPWCKFVRKARFDEIPQMINILKGDMSIVGPRAEWTEVAKVYEKEIPGYSLRMMVNTAWTGWAQINQGYCFSSDNEAVKLQYDLYYIKHRNIFWDISILVKAVFLALGGRHA